MKKFLTLLIVLLLSFATTTARAETIAIDIRPDTNEGYLKGTNVGNKQSFEIKFNLSELPVNANIISAQLSYTQGGTSAGLVRFIDKYTTDTIDSKSLSSEGTQNITSILAYLRRWQASSSQNLGILVSSAAFGADDSIFIRDFKLQVIYDLPDTTPPQIISVLVTEVGPTYARMIVETDEMTNITISYGKTSLYNQFIRADSTVFNTSHEIVFEQLVSGSTVHYKITLTDAAGNKFSSNDSTFETTNDATAQTITRIDNALSTPQNLKADIVYSVNSAHVSLNWQSVPEQEIKGFIIYRSTAPDLKYKEYATTEGRNNTFIDTSIELGKKYFYYIRSYSENVISPKSASQSVDIPKTIPNQSINEPATQQILLVIVASAGLILFIFYLIIRIGRSIPDKKVKKQKLVNVLKDPTFYIDRDPT